MGDEKVIPFRHPLESETAPFELLWSFWQDSHSWSGEVQFSSEFNGWDALIRRDGALVIAQRFPLHDKAARFAEDLRGCIERGWTD